MMNYQPEGWTKYQRTMGLLLTEQSSVRKFSSIVEGGERRRHVKLLGSLK